MDDQIPERERNERMGSSATVEELLSLQLLDIEIVEMAKELERVAGEIESERMELEVLEDRVVEQRKKLEEADERLRKFQRSVQAGRATLKRLEGRAQAVTKMDQHLAVRIETETARRNLRIAEEDAMDALHDSESARVRLGDLETELAELRGSFESRSEQVERQRSELKDGIAVREGQKKNRELHIERRVLRLYETVRSGRTDSALAPLTPDGVCGHCYTSVPLQRRADIRAGRDLAVCEGCGVILYASAE